jgi:hypothetical protein
VGPDDRWDKVRDAITPFLIECGLKPEHTLCDVGCGTMRNGKILIDYLDAENYYGIEAAKAALDEGIAKELDAEVINAKTPHFLANSTFNLAFFDVHMDWILSYAVFIHCGRKQLRQLLKNIRDMVIKFNQPTTLLLDLNIGPRKVERGKIVRYESSHCEVVYPENLIRKILKNYGGEILSDHKLSIDIHSNRKQFMTQFIPQT